MTTLDDVFSQSKAATDPVCDMEVDVADPPGGTAAHEGVTYYFCGPGCRQAFVDAPASFLSK